MKKLALLQCLLALFASSAILAQEKISFTMTFNKGNVPSEHWIRLMDATYTLKQTPMDESKGVLNSSIDRLKLLTEFMISDRDYSGLQLNEKLEKIGAIRWFVELNESKFSPDEWQRVAEVGYELVKSVNELKVDINETPAVLNMFIEYFELMKL